MSNAYFTVPEPYNEPIRSYAPGSPEKKELKDKLADLQTKEVEIPLIIGGEEVRTERTADIRPSHDHKKKLGMYHKGGKKEVEQAIKAALEARKTWAEMPWEHRVSIFLKAADLLAGPWRSTLNAATMLGQSKTVFQAEIDSACELIDFWRFNSYYMTQLMEDQPYSPPGFWNRCEYRPLEGFVFAVTPFNFTSIAGNLPTAPAMVGNVVLWKPASTAVYPAYHIMKLLEKAAGRKLRYYTIHGTARLFARVIWKRWKAKTPKIPERFPLESFYNFPTFGLDLFCYSNSKARAVQVTRKKISEGKIVHIHPGWLFQRGTINHRGAFYEVFRILLAVDQEMKTITVRQKFFFKVASDRQEYQKDVIPLDYCALFAETSE